MLSSPLTFFVSAASVISVASSASVAKRQIKFDPAGPSSDISQSLLQQDNQFLCFLCSNFNTGKYCLGPDKTSEKDIPSFLESEAELNVNYAFTNDSDSVCLIGYAVDTGVTYIQALVPRSDCKDRTKHGTILELVTEAAGGLARVICCNHAGCNWSWSTALQNKEIDPAAMKFTGPHEKIVAHADDVGYYYGIGQGVLEGFGLLTSLLLAFVKVRNVIVQCCTGGEKKNAGGGAGTHNNITVTKYCCLFYCCNFNCCCSNNSNDANPQSPQSEVTLPTSKAKPNEQPSDKSVTKSSAYAIPRQKPAARVSPVRAKSLDPVRESKAGTESSAGSNANIKSNPGPETAQSPIRAQASLKPNPSHTPTSKSSVHKLQKSRTSSRQTNWSSNMSEYKK